MKFTVYSYLSSVRILLMRVIEDGAWPDNSPYGTIHRIAGDGQVKGLLQLCVAFCKTQN